MEIKTLLQTTMWIVIDGLAALGVVHVLFSIVNQNALGETLLFLAATLYG